MADTLTAKGLTILDPNLAYDVNKFNANFNLINNLLGTIICTSTTRPSTSLYDGMTLWETDTQRFVNRVAGAWVPVPGTVIVANQATRDAITTKYDGMQVWRQDKDWTEVYDGAAWRVQGIVSVAALADITNPFTGQMALLTTDNVVYRWNGSAWVGAYPVGGITTATRHKAKYRQTGTAQAPATGTQQRVNFTQTDYDTNDWTTAFTGGGIVFTCARAGNYGVTFNGRFVGGVAAERAFTLAVNGAPMGTPYGTVSNYTGGTAPWSACVHIEQDFSVGDTLCAFAYQAAAATLAFDLTSSPTSITFEYKGMKNT